MRVLSSSRRSTRWLIGSAAILAALVTLADKCVARAQARREFLVTVSDDFHIAGSDKKEIRVKVGDLVRITFDAQDIPHSFTTAETTPHYRIDRRAEPGKPITFEFRADQETNVPILCRLTMESRCKDMRAYLIVTAK